MKYSFSILFLMFCPLLWSQGSSLKSEYSNKLSKAHVNIPGTKVFMIPGEGFHLSDNVKGFQKDGNTGFGVLAELDGGNFNINSKNIDRANFEKQGMKVVEYSELTIDGFNAKFVCFKLDETILAYRLIFGDSTFSVILMATHEFSDTKSAEEIKESLFSVVYDKSFVVDALKSAFFHMDVTDSRFKFATSSSGIYVYTVNGVKEDIEKQEHFIILATIPNDRLATAEMVTIMMLREIESHGMENMDIASRTQTKVNGYEAFELTATGKVLGKERKLYHLTIVHDKKSVVFQGYSESDFESDLAEFKKLVKTIKIK